MLWPRLLAYAPVFIGPFLVVVPWWVLRLGGRSLAPPSLWSLMAGLVLFLFGAAAGGRCVWDFGRTGRGTPLPFDAPREHVAVGLYRYVRNPMQLGYVLILLGEAVAYLSVALLAYALAVWLCLHLFVILYEEPTLRRKFGDGYRTYCASVSRWAPRVRRDAVL